MRFPRGTALSLVCSSGHTDGWALGLRESDASDGGPAGTVRPGSDDISTVPSVGGAFGLL